MKVAFQHVIITIALAYVPTAASCPLIVSGDLLIRSGVNGRSPQIAAYTVDPNAGWRRVPLQYDLMNADGQLLFPGDKDYRKRDFNIEVSDRILLTDESFGQRLEKVSLLPCGAQKALEFRHPFKKKYTYVVVCQIPHLHAPESNKVHYDKKKQTLWTDSYRYIYDEDNHMLFNRIEVRTEDQYKSAAESARLSIRADLKNFFSLNFDSDDIRSYIDQYFSTSNAVMGKLTFLLKILMFTIDLRLDTVVNFYKSSVRIPMIMHMPASARKWVHPGSGLFYTWKQRPDVLALSGRGTMPHFREEIIKSGYRAVAERGLGNCKGSACEYVLLGHGEQFYFQMLFRIPRYMVASGFYPQFCQDVANARKNLGWPDDDQELHGERIGVYFDNSGLQKGNHRWEFWMSIANSSERLANRPCPRHPTFMRMVSLAGR